MTDQETLEETFRDLAEAQGDDAAVDALEELLADARDKRLKGEPLVDRSVDVADYEFDTDERRLVSEKNGTLVDPNGENVRQALQGTVEVVAIEDGQLLLDGDTYDAKGHIKAVDYQHRSFDGDRKVWVVDIEAIEDLHRNLNGGGYLLVDAQGGEPEPSAEDRREQALDRLGEFIDETAKGDRVVVEYEMKNGNGTNSKEGVIERINLPDDEWREEPQLIFKRDDGQTMYVEVDDYGKLGLFTSMSAAPYVGEVTGYKVAEGQIA